MSFFLFRFNIAQISLHKSNRLYLKLLKDTKQRIDTKPGDIGEEDYIDYYTLLCNILTTTGTKAKDKQQGRQAAAGYKATTRKAKRSYAYNILNKTTTTKLAN